MYLLLSLHRRPLRCGQAFSRHGSGSLLGYDGYVQGQVRAEVALSYKRKVEFILVKRLVNRYCVASFENSAQGTQY